jgi:hypothetical protein
VAYEVTSIEASHKSPNTSQPEGPVGWIFSIVSDPVDGGAPHRLLVERLAAALPTSRLTFPFNTDKYYFEALILWENAEVAIWAELLEGFIQFWSLKEEIIERLRSECLRLVPELF